jgi:hypothetical protein
VVSVPRATTRGVSLRASRDFAEEFTALRALAAWLEDAMQEEVRGLDAVRGSPLLLVDRDLAFRLVDTPMVWDMLCQHDA